VYIDIWGLAPVTANGSKYYIAFLDAYSKFTWLYLSHSKSQISYVFILFKSFVENQTNHKIKFIQTDNAKEYIALAPYLNNHDIRHQLTYTHEQNDFIECKHKHINDIGLSLLVGATLPRNFWG